MMLGILDEQLSDFGGRETEKNRVKMTLIVKDGDKTKELNYDGRGCKNL